MTLHHPRWLAFATAGLLLSSTASAQQLVTDHLVAFLDFDEGSGSIALDGTGNGHDATLVGGVTWGSGYVHVHDDGDVVRVDSSSALRSHTFTYDVWFEARGSSLGGRLIHQADHVGGDGPDILEWYGRKISMRITRGGDAVFDTPLVGSLTSPQPPDHTGQCDESFNIQDGPEHLVFIHDAAGKRVKVFQGLDGDPLELTFDATYTGSYSVSSSDLTLGNVLNGEDRVHPSRFYQFAYYDKVLSHTVGGNGHASSGEVLENHQAGPDVLMGDDEPDAGPVDDGGAGAVCDDLRSDEYDDALTLLDVDLGDPARITFHVQGVPDPVELNAATITMSLYDADHAGEEGTVYVNGQGPLDLPAQAAWDDLDSNTALDVPVSMLVEGDNTIAFGAGSRDQTYYRVGRVALTVEGPICDPAQPEDDAGVPDGGGDPSDAGVGGAGSGGGGSSAVPPMDPEDADGLDGACSCVHAGQDRHGSQGAAWAMLVLLGLAVTRKRRAS